MAQLAIFLFYYSLAPVFTSAQCSHKLLIKNEWLGGFLSNQRGPQEHMHAIGHMQQLYNALHVYQMSDKWLGKPKNTDWNVARHDCVLYK